jgi:hypothetical protein
MKYFLIYLLALTLTSFTVGSGAKMRITVVDENNSVVSGAQVQVFATFKNYEDESNPVATGETNAKGFVQFKGLKEQKYYVLIKKGSMNNHSSSNETDVLHLKGKNRFEIMID